MKIDNSDNMSGGILVHNAGAGNTGVSAKSTGGATRSSAQTDNFIISQMSGYELGNMPVSEKVVIEAIQRANKAISGGNRRFEFSIHEKTNEIVVKVIDSETDQLIREIPNEKVLDMVAKICEMAGILVDERR